MSYFNRNTTDNSAEKISSIWTKMTNPLRFLSTPEIERLLEMARQGQDVRLQAIYALIEQQTPIFSVCMEKRCAGLANRNWDVIPNDTSSEAIEQAKKVKKILMKSDELSENSLTDALRTLQQGAFRGRAYVKPFVRDGQIIWKKLENWNVLRAFNKNWWNPRSEPPCLSITDEESWRQNLVEIPYDEVCYTLYNNPIDLPGVTIYLRQLVGETKWAQMVERRGNPQIVITAPAGTPDSNMGIWNQRAIQIQNGASGVLDDGATITQLVDARTDEPFNEFVKHQEEIICIMAIGGALNTLGGATGLGSNLAEKQDEHFQSLINLDAKKIQNTINAVAIEKICREILGQDRICRFKFTEQDDTTAAEYLELALKARDLGAAIDIAKLKDITNLEFISLPNNPNGEIEAWQP